MSMWGQLMFQDPASPLMMQLINLHDHSLVILTLVLTVVSYAMTMIMMNKLYNRYLMEAQQIELIWTILPSIILLYLAFPSLRLLYLMDEMLSPAMTMKAVGHQWYWSYEYSDFNNTEFDSYMLPSSELKNGEYRLLEVDNRTPLPMSTEIRLIVTAMDVIHSWTIQSIGMKVDAVPGRLNQLSFSINRPGIFYGQCSEICGANHSFMPIVLESININSFIKWMKEISN